MQSSLLRRARQGPMPSCSSVWQWPDSSRSWSGYGHVTANLDHAALGDEGKLGDPSQQEC